MAMRWTALGLLFLIPAAARADGTVALRITDDGLHWIAQAAMAKVPHEVDIADTSSPLLDCWDEPSTFEITDGHLTVDDIDMSLPIDHGELGVNIETSVHGTGTIFLNAIGCLPLSATCDVTIEANHVAMSSNLELGHGDDGQFVAGLGDVTFDLQPDDVDFSFANCTGGIEDRLDTLYDQAERGILSMMQTQLQTFVDASIRPQIDQVLSGSLALPLDSADLDATVAIQDAAIRSDAVEISAQVGLTPRTVSACIPAAEAPDSSGRDEIQFTRWDPNPFAISVTEHMANEGMTAAWLSGKLCFPPKDLSGLGGVVPGIPEGVDLTLAFAIGAPPQIAFDPDGLRVSFDQVEASVHYTSPEGEGDAVLAGAASARALLEFDPATNGIHLSTFDLATEDLAPVSGELPAGTNLTSIIDDLVFPTLLQLVGDVRIMDAVLPLQGYWVIVDAVDYFDGAAAIAFELFATPADDTVGPDTEVVDAPTDVVPKAREVTIHVSGSDDQVPVRLLRYQLRDEEGGTYSEPSFSPVFRVRKYRAGSFSYELRAIDLSGNVDPEPARFTLQVSEDVEQSDHPDALPPPDHHDTPADAYPSYTQDKGGCTCRAGGGTPSRSVEGLFGAVLALVMVGRRRRPGR
jgi:MYXO-CTERM domain-containing protein